MKAHTLGILMLGSLAFGANTVAHADTSFNLSTVSLYKSRGVDQDGRDKAFRPAVQGGVDYASSSGLYVGNWNSTGHFGDARVEMDLYGGYKAQINKDFGLDVGYIHYLYPNERSWNDGEAYVGLSYRQLTFKTYRGMLANVNEGNLYYQLAYSYPLTGAVSLNLGLGYLDYQTEGLSNKTDYSAGLSYAFAKHLTVSGTVAGANHRDQVDDGSRDTRFIVGLGATF